MQIKHTNLSGAVTYWKAADSDIDRTRAALGDHCPPDEAPASILRRALTAEYANPTTLVRPLAQAGRFAVVIEDRGRASNVYATALTATVDDTGAIDADPYNELPRVAEAYRRAAAVMPGARVSAGLVKAVGALGGVSLRPSGGIYYIPPQTMPDFEALAQRIEAAAMQAGETAVYVLRTPTDQNTARAIVDALVSESEAEAARIEADATGGELGARGLKTREKEAGALLDRLTEYEALLGVNLDRTRAALDRAKTAAATAALMGAAADGEVLLYAH